MKAKEADFTIREDLKNFLTPLTEEAKAELERSILEIGIQQKLNIGVIGGEHKFLLDGHNRFEIAQAHDQIEFETLETQCDDELDMKNIMVGIQLGRRNINELEKAYLRGARYENEKLMVGGTGNNQYVSKSDTMSELQTAKQIDNGGSDTMSEAQQTAKQLGSEFNVSSRTIERDALFTKGVDILEISDTGLKNKILLGESNLKKNQIQEVGKLDVSNLSQSEVSLTVKKLLTEQQKPKPKKNEAPVTATATIPLPEPDMNVVTTTAPAQTDIEYKFKPTTKEYDIININTDFYEHDHSYFDSLPIPAKSDSYIFLWVPHEIMNYGFELFNKWGIDYITALVWDYGIIQRGVLSDEQCRFCLVGSVGDISMNLQLSDYFYEETDKTEIKPKAFFQMIEKCFPESDKLDYFGAQNLDNWDKLSDEERAVQPFTGELITV